MTNIYGCTLFCLITMSFKQMTLHLLVHRKNLSLIMPIKKEGKIIMLAIKILKSIPENHNKR